MSKTPLNEENKELQLNEAQAEEPVAEAVVTEEASEEKEGKNRSKIMFLYIRSFLHFIN